MMEIHNMMDFHHMVDIHHMMKFHHMMGFHHFVFSLWNQFQLWKNIMHWRSFSFRDELGEATVCGKHRLADLGDDQYGLDHPAAAADGDPSCFWDLQQLFLANWCLHVGCALQLLGAHFARRRSHCWTIRSSPTATQSCTTLSSLCTSFATVIKPTILL